jgi:hypothetical protein
MAVLFGQLEGGGKVKSARNFLLFGMLGFLGAGLLLSGCKSAPELTQANAQALIQAKYDQTPAVGVNIAVDQLGLGEGVAAKYWERGVLYPNRYWADFKLTPDGKKAVKLPNGGDVLQWRPENAADKRYSVLVVTVAANHLKAQDLKEIENETVAGVSTAKGVMFSEVANLDGVPGPLAGIAHNPGNKLSAKRHAIFSFEDGAWKLHSIE